MSDRIIRKDGDRTAVKLNFPDGPGRTKQSFIDECDVNFIMNKWKRTGQLPPTHTRPPTYGDFSNVVDYMQAKNSILESDRAFMALPAWLRQRFQNDPAELIAYVDAEENLDACIELGLTEAPPGYEPPGSETPPGDSGGPPEPLGDPPAADPVTVPTP